VTVSDYVAFAACGDPMMDQDGNIYGTVEINGLCWFSENVTAGLYADGSPIEEIQDSLEWSATNSGAWAHANNSPELGELYGKLYNWAAVTDARGICTASWRLPTRAEHEALIVAAGTDPFIGLMATTGWPEGVTGTDLLGYSGRPGGMRYTSDVTAYGESVGWGPGEFLNVGDRGLWWSSTPHETEANTNYVLDLLNYRVQTDRPGPRQGQSVRCVL